MSESTAATPVPAATILMLRDSDEGLEVFMVVRHHQIDFASGALVFPGGKISPGDLDVREHASGGEALDDVQFSMQAGAIREAFEESGILLACEKGHSELISGTRLAELDHHRDPLNRDEISLKDFLESEGLNLKLDCLHHFAHWITPEMLPRRFDTHFYLAKSPADHLAVHDGHESVDSVWIKPADALTEAEQGKRIIIFPTRSNIAMLGSSHSVDEAIRDANKRKIITILPWTEKREDGVYLCIRTDAGYEVSEEIMTGMPA